MKFRWRIAIWVGELLLGFLCYEAMQLNYEQVAVATAVGIVALLPKLVESEEKGGIDGTNTG